jgi:hypothetical protein
MSSGTLFVVETEERCLRTIEAARESIRLSCELHLLIGEKLLRGEMGPIMPCEKGKWRSDSPSVVMYSSYNGSWERGLPIGRIVELTGWK